MKFSLIMPTYNDAESIVESLESIINQTYKKWELIIVDDGSTDDTKKVITKFKKKNDINKQIKYIYQENTDQLNAIKNGIKYISGDYVYIIHSDDLFADEYILEKVNKIIKENKSYDAFIAKESFLINESSEITGKQYFLDYKNKEYIMPLQLLWLGRQLYWDFAFFKKKIFVNQVKENYLTWNMPFWLNNNLTPSMLNVKTLNFSFIKYRVFEGNYINNEIGKLNVINGELRTATRLMKNFYIPFYKTQYFCFRVFNKLKLVKIFKPFYLKKESKNKYKVVNFIIDKRYNKNDIEKYPFLLSLSNFYLNYHPRSIIIKNIAKDEFIFLGSDMRKFNNDMLKNNLSKLYNNLLQEMNEGFNEIITSKEDYEKIENIVKFLCIYPYVKIKIEKE